MTSTRISTGFIDAVNMIEEIPTFISFNDESKFMVIALHEHFGLVQNFKEICEFLVNDKASLIVPDLFYNIDDKILDESELAPLKNLEINDVYHALRVCLKFAKVKQKTPILVGFSIGAALGLKLLQQIEDWELAVFFYGLPRLDILKPDKIRCPTLIFLANNDKISYLSNRQKIQQAEDIFEGSQFVQVQRLDCGHAFMNHEHVNYDQKTAQYCRKVFLNNLKLLESDLGQKNVGRRKKEKGNPQQVKQENKADDGCFIY